MNRKLTVSDMHFEFSLKKKMQGKFVTKVCEKCNTPMGYVFAKDGMSGVKVLYDSSCQCTRVRPRLTVRSFNELSKQYNKLESEFEIMRWNKFFNFD